MSTATKKDAIAAAMSIAEDVSAGTLAPGDLEAQLVKECRALFGTVAGEGDPLLRVQIDVARAVLAAGLIPADELSQWLAAAKHRASLATGADGDTQAGAEQTGDDLAGTYG